MWPKAAAQRYRHEDRGVNGQAHAIGSGLGMALAAYYDATRPDGRPKTVEEVRSTALVAGGLGALCGSLPDLIEPATNPHHRQFFHSVAFAALAFEGLRRVYRWQPEDDLHRAIRGLTLIAGGAYLIHLVMDSTTPMSLPLVGRL